MKCNNPACHRTPYCSAERLLGLNACRREYRPPHHQERGWPHIVVQPAPEGRPMPNWLRSLGATVKWIALAAGALAIVFVACRLGVLGWKLLPEQWQIALGGIAIFCCLWGVTHGLLFDDDGAPPRRGDLPEQL